jgi:dienelactone hydrolase
MIVFGPQSAVVLLLLVAAFGGLAYGMARRGRLLLRLGSGVLAFAIASVFGMALVNRFYDYYQTWGDLYNDLAGHQPGLAALPPTGGRALAPGGERAKNGLLVSAPIGGSKSGISRDGLVYLPPEYFQPQFADVKFPVLELMHGSPGRPTDWQTGLHLTETYKDLLAKKKAKPAILVVPDINGTAGGATGSQCLDHPGGVQNDTYLSQDVPADVIGKFRAQPVGAHWGVAGFSEGGFCAANLALRHPQVYAVSGVMSGYFQPLPERGVDPFHGDAQARLANDPMWLLSRTSVGGPIPSFWLMAGSSDRGDTMEAQLFKSVLLQHGENAPLVLIPRARHTFAAWNPALPKLLTWATERLSRPAGAAALDAPDQVPPA